MLVLYLLFCTIDIISVCLQTPGRMGALWGQGVYAGHLSVPGTYAWLRPDTKQAFIEQMNSPKQVAEMIRALS